MTPVHQRLGLFLILGLVPAQAALADPLDDNDDQSKADIVVTGTVPADESVSATGLPLTLRETPQSVTIIDRARIDDFALNNVNDVLDQTVGINVQRNETDRTTFNSRGFDITNFQVDGIGLPLISALQTGDLDTILWERVEAVRGANAIMTGIGNPSATINYVRKRPTDTLRAAASLQLGSWNEKRFQGDISSPLDAAGTLRARLIFAHEDQDSYLDYNHVDRNVYGGIVSWDVTPTLTATAGYMRQDNKSDGVLWGALPLNYSDGSRIDYPVSASTGAPWTYWDVHDQTAFAELAYDIGHGWSAKGVFTYRRLDSEAKLLYAYGYPDRETGLGIGGMSGIYPSNYDQYLGDLYASGPFRLFGREHQLSLGFSTARANAREYENFSEATIDYPDVRTLGSVVIPEPSYPGAYLAADYGDRLTRLYGSAQLNVTDRLKAVVGASAMRITSTGQSYGVDQSRKVSAVSPYLGAVFDLTPNVSLYASYTDIFNPQSEVDAGNRKLDPAQGSSYEAGIKSEWFDKRLYLTASLFRAKQKGLAEYAGTFDGNNGPLGKSYYTGVDTTAKGFEIEVAGRITDHWSLSGGYTGLQIEDESGAPTRTFLPTRTLKLSTSYIVPELRDLKLGAQLRWQNTTRYTDSAVQDYGIVTGDVIVRQNAYTVVDLMAGIRLIDRVRATINLRNVTDAKYLGGLSWGQAYYAAPRSFAATLSFAY